MRNIPHSKEMILAFAAGNKTQTRRVRGLKEINENPDKWIFERRNTVTLNSYFMKLKTEQHQVAVPSNVKSVKYPYGKPGDLVYLGEGIRNKNGFAVYDADGTDVLDDINGGYLKWKWKSQFISSVYMPANAARYFAKIEKVRVERVKSITEADAKAEGVRFTDFGTQPGGSMSFDGGKTFLPCVPIQKCGYHVFDVTSSDQCLGTAGSAYANLWGKINGKASWNLNPWVWVTEYKRHTPFCKTLVAEATAKKEGVCQQ